MSDEARRAQWTTRPPWWTLPAANTLDRATAHLPRLLYERLDDFGIDFARNVELAFSPSAAVRPVEYGFFCRSGPMVTPHVKGQLTVEPGQALTVPTSFHEGDYRLRTLEAGGEVDITWERGGFPAVRVVGDEITTAPAPEPGFLAVANDGDVRRTVVIEDRSWRREVLTAERVTTLQAFRDLFSDQVLRPGDEVEISTVAFMFTDLRGSTALYSEVGDAAAYHIVREHYAVLLPLVREHDGTVVKTIGDGLHAAFISPDDAFRAAVAMQHAVADWVAFRL